MTPFETIRETVITCLDEHGDKDDPLIDALNEIVMHHGDCVYPVLFQVLTHMELPMDTAKAYWSEIITHRQKICQKLDRNVNLRTAICDFFCSIKRSLKNPIVVEIHVFEEKLKFYKYDKLTGLYTRRFFDEALTQEVSRSNRYDSVFSILFLDLDDFKKINDTYGHAAGDIALKNVAEVILHEIRTDDMAARYGGEEIVVLLPETGKVEALVLGERIREKIEGMTCRHNDQKIKVTVSGGLASFPADSTDLASLVVSADKALYKAKAEGKNKITLFSPNKRRYLRIDFFSEINVRKIGFNGTLKGVTVKSKDLSAAGILFESDFLMDIGTRIQLQIKNDTFKDDLQIDGTVVRVELLDTDKYDIGVSFLGLNRSVKNELIRFLEKEINRDTTIKH